MEIFGIKVNAAIRLTNKSKILAADAKDAGKLTLMFNNYFGMYKNKGMLQSEYFGDPLVEWVKGQDTGRVWLQPDEKMLELGVSIGALNLNVQGDFAGAIVKQLIRGIDRELEEYDIDIARYPSDKKLKKERDRIVKFRSCLRY